MTNTLNWDKNGNIYYTDSDGNLIQNQAHFQETFLNKIQKVKIIAQHLTPQERSDILMGGIAMLAPIKGLNYIGRVNTYNKIKQIYDLRKDWGIAYRSLSGKPKEAINKLMQERKGWVPAAQRKKGLGEIDYIWGKHNPETNIGGGLEHIEFQRARQGIDTDQFIKNIPENINRGIIKNNERYLNRKNIETPDSKIVIGTDWNGAKRNWMITAFKQNKSANKRLMNDAPLSNITFGNGTRSIPKLVAPSYIIPQNELNFNATNEFIKKLLEFDTEDLKQNNSDSSKKFIQMLLKQEKEI